MGQSTVNSAKIFDLLRHEYPNAKIILNYSNPWELTVAVILSAQCTDKRVNVVTKQLFIKYPLLDDYLKADIKEFEQEIRSTGFYRNKAKNILASAKIVKKKYNGKVPNSMKEILTLPGIARKSANVILGNAYGVVEGIAIDTHVRRLSLRLKLTKHMNPEKIERDLMKLFPKKNWFSLTYLLIEHGRAVCDAKKSHCSKCVLSALCPSAFQVKGSY
jgi:endonuclease-3